MVWTYNTPEGTPTDGPQITGISLAFTALSLLAVGLRIYVRGWLIKAFGADDWVILITWVASCGFAIVTSIQTLWGLGLTNLKDMPLENIFNFGLLQYTGAPFYISSILGFKLSLLLSYLRFMPKGLYRNLTIGVAIACILFHLSFLIVQVNLCAPISKQWDPAVVGGSCLPGVTVYTTMASLTILFDVAVMFLPFPVLAKSKIQKRKKFVLLGLFALGLFITIIQIIRIQTVKSLSNLLDSAALIMWSAVENNLGIIVACIPTLAPLIKYFAERSRNGTSANSRSRGPAGSRYALQTWKSQKNGMQPLGSGIDRDTDITGKSKGDSTEFILDTTGIVKQTNITVSRELRDGQGIAR